MEWSEPGPFPFDIFCANRVFHLLERMKSVRQASRELGMSKMKSPKAIPQGEGERARIKLTWRGFYFLLG